ncbi:hypothetical protein OS493_031302 [Desmophyllum pertusum]|uniref:Uncharacterized protein n=1 Tax=Desmophyllum pertusum TaxID=174260 RepID=A0A9W9YW67_9CNID|nr:hypothetical protein OS493_031302 [Desmophyllum pertusum]
MSPTEFIIMIATLLVIILRVQVTLASVTQCKDATYSIPNRVLASHAFLTKPSPNIEDCVIMCIEHRLCESSNYYRKTKVCELNDKTVISNPEDMVDFEWAIYMTNNVRILPCYDFDFECGRQADICHLIKGGNMCKECGAALGLENGKIPDAAITASSFHSAATRPNGFRLNSESPSSWSVSVNNHAQWLQVDLGRIMAIKKVATQGRRIDSHHQWVTSYKVSSREDAWSNWEMYTENNAVKVFRGNTDKDTVVYNVFPQHIKARFVRILPQTWYHRISMRAELYGCSLE